jgi:excisionase family DNA binding protein
MPASTSDIGTSLGKQSSSVRAVTQCRQQRRGSDMAVPEPVQQIELSASAIARLLASDMREEMLAVMREIFERNALAGRRLAFSLDEAAELLGISKELVHDLLRTGQLGSVKAGRRRLWANATVKRSWAATVREQRLAGFAASPGNAA